jgi:hypothetical protein
MPIMSSSRPGLRLAGILLRSDAAPLRALPIGEGLTDHVGVGFAFEATDRLQREAAEFERAGRSTWRRSRSRRAARPVARACATSSCSRRSTRRARGLPGHGAVFAMKPASRGTVRLSAADPRAPLAIDHGFLTDERDVAVLVDGVAALRAMAASESVSAYAAREARPGPRSTPSATSRRGARLLPSGRHVRHRVGGRR